MFSCQHHRTDMQQPVNQQANNLNGLFSSLAKHRQSAPRISAWLSDCVFVLGRVCVFMIRVCGPLGRSCCVSPRGPSLSSTKMRCVKCEMPCRLIHTCCAHEDANQIQYLKLYWNKCYMVDQTYWIQLPTQADGGNKGKDLPVKINLDLMSVS